MSIREYDVVIIGSGPSGEGAAMNMAKHNKTVAVIERNNVVGGNCIHRGTIPSKTLRHAVKFIAQLNNSPFLKHNNANANVVVPFPQLLEHTQTIISKQVRMRNEIYSRNRVDLFHGIASFVDKNTIEVVLGAETHTFKAKSIIIATGSRPYKPKGVDFKHKHVFNSDTILDLTYTPRTLIVYGAGVIGCEYSSIFSSLSTRVDLVNTQSKLLSFLDSEISDALSYHLRDHGVLIHQNEDFDNLETHENGVVLNLKSGKRIKADAFLWANGREGNTASLGLDKIDLKVDSRGLLKVDKHYETAVKGIYAVGDAVGWPSLASASYSQGRSASAFMLKEQSSFVDEVPSGIYTIPEISSLGKTEEQLSADKVPYDVGRAFFKEMARAQITNELVGMLKILFHRETLEILGIHCFGSEASEIIHIGQSVMLQEGKNNNLNYFVDTTFNYPTMAEVYRVAAMRGLNRVS
jgi:NAD(P) transhydrogenase